MFDFTFTQAQREALEKAAQNMGGLGETAAIDAVMRTFGCTEWDARRRVRVFAEGGHPSQVTHGWSLFR